MEIQMTNLQSQTIALIATSPLAQHVCFMLLICVYFQPPPIKLSQLVIASHKAQFFEHYRLYEVTHKAERVSEDNIMFLA